MGTLKEHGRWKNSKFLFTKLVTGCIIVLHVFHFCYGNSYAKEFLKRYCMLKSMVHKWSESTIEDLERLGIPYKIAHITALNIQIS